MIGITAMSVNCLNVKAVPPTYHRFMDYFYQNSLKDEFYPIYCLENDSLGIYIDTVTNVQKTTLILSNQTNRDLWWADQSYSPILTWYSPMLHEFTEVIIPDDGFYYLGGWFNDTTGNSYMIIDIIHVHSSTETPSQYINNTYNNETYNIYDTEDPANSAESGTISFGWGFGIVAGVVIGVLIIKNRKNHPNLQI